MTSSGANSSRVDRLILLEREQLPQFDVLYFRNIFPSVKLKCFSFSIFTLFTIKSFFFLPIILLRSTEICRCFFSSENLFDNEKDIMFSIIRTELLCLSANESIIL